MTQVTNHGRKLAQGLAVGGAAAALTGQANATSAVRGGLGLGMQMGSAGVAAYTGGASATGALGASAAAGKAALIATATAAGPAVAVGAVVVGVGILGAMALSAFTEKRG